MRMLKYVAFTITNHHHHHHHSQLPNPRGNQRKRRRRCKACMRDDCKGRGGASRCDQGAAGGAGGVPVVLASTVALPKKRRAPARCKKKMSDGRLCSAYRSNCNANGSCMGPFLTLDEFQAETNKLRRRNRERNQQN